MKKLAPFLNLSREVVFAMLRDLVIEEAKRAPFGLVAIEEGAEAELAREAARYRAMSLQEILAECARGADGRHGPPQVPGWAVALDAEDRSKR